ncbi:MAG: glycine cleavage system protein H [Terriglobia bacterium]
MAAIFVAFIFVSMVLTDLGVTKWKAARARRPESITAVAPEALWQVPEGIHLSNSHTWFKPDPAGGLITGADSFLTYAIGTVSRIVLPKPGDQVTAGQPLFRLVQDGRSITVPSTVTGKVLAANDRLINKPALLNSDPYGSGWICQITPTFVEGGASSRYFGKRAMQWLEAEFNRLSGFLSAQIPAELLLGATSQDGGYPSCGCLSELDSAAWGAFEKEFLSGK